MSFARLLWHLFFTVRLENTRGRTWCVLGTDRKPPTRGSRSRYLRLYCGQYSLISGPHPEKVGTAQGEAFPEHLVFQLSLNLSSWFRELNPISAPFDFRPIGRRVAAGHPLVQCKRVAPVFANQRAWQPTPRPRFLRALSSVNNVNNREFGSSETADQQQQEVRLLRKASSIRGP